MERVGAAAADTQQAPGDGNRTASLTLQEKTSDCVVAGKQERRQRSINKGNTEASLGDGRCEPQSSGGEKEEKGARDESWAQGLSQLRHGSLG